MSGIEVTISLCIDVNSCVLPTKFKVFGLRLADISDAVSKGTDSFMLDVKDMPNPSLILLADAIRDEFIKRNTKVAL